MPTLSHRPPTLCRHRHSGRAYVKLDGLRHYLGKWNSKEAKAAYRAFIKQWEVTGAAPSDSRSAESIEAAEIAADYLEKSIGKYKPNPVTGEPSSELGVARLAMRAWIAEFGELPVTKFGPVCFQRLRAVWVDQKLAPETVSHYVRHIKRALKHAVALEKLPASVVTAIACVEPLKQAEHKHEPQPAPKLVIDETIKATIKHLPPMLADAVMLLRESGMRPCELCLMRPCDIDRSQREWEYRPQTHKTAHKGKVRIVQLGPACQRILKKYFATTAPEDYIFSPAIVMEQRRQAKAAARVTPLSCGNRRGSNVKRHRLSREPLRTLARTIRLKRGRQKRYEKHTSRKPLSRSVCRQQVQRQIIPASKSRSGITFSLNANWQNRSLEKSADHLHSLTNHSAAARNRCVFYAQVFCK